MRFDFDRPLWVEVLITVGILAIMAVFLIGGIRDYLARCACTDKGGTVDWTGSESWKCADLPAEDPR
jgi:hypothetical protein